MHIARRVLFALTVASRLSGAQAASLPTPASVIGFPVGTDYKLITYDESIRYFEALARATPYMKLLDVGKTSTGHSWTLAIISSPANLAKLNGYKAIAQRIAHPEGLTDDQAHALAREGKAFVDISGGLHASEIAGSQHTIQLAYDLISKQSDPRVKAILDNTILLLWPSINPDGQNIVANWYRENVNTPYEIAPLHELYQKYIGHDNNRDAYMLNVVESRVVARVWREWEPNVIYVQHQTAPFPTRIWLPPFAEPVAPRVPALMAREVNTIGMTIAQMLESNGMPGATHMGTGFDAWYPGYIDYMPMLQNIAAFWTETALYNYATPHFYTINDFPRDMRDLRPQSLYASPWAGGWWRIKDAIDYMETGSIAVLDYAAKYREDLIYNRYQAGRNAIARYRKDPPYAYVIAKNQRDPVAAAELLRRLAFNGVRVSELQKDMTVNGAQFTRGSWVIPMDQEFAELVRQLFDIQEYPDLRESPDGPPEQPYDAAGWTLPMQMDVRVAEVRSPLTAEFRSSLKAVHGTTVDWRTHPDAPFTTDSNSAGIVPLAGRLAGSGDVLALTPAENNTFRVVNRALAGGGTVRFSNRKYMVSGVASSKLNEWASELAIHGDFTGNGVAGSSVRSRIGLYKPFTASMDEGWTEWLLDNYDFKYTTVSNTDVKAGALTNRYDVILMASDRPRTIEQGFAKGSVPPQYEGGLSDAGARALDEFVRAGGTLVCLNSSADYAISALHLPVKNVIDTLSRKSYFSSGSILEVIADTTHPVMAGMPDRAKVFVDGSPVLTTLDGFEGSVIAKYAPSGSPRVSGYLLGEKYIQGRAAAVDVKLGRGHVVLIGFRPQWRGQPFGTFRVVFNSALFGGAVAQNARGAAGFWSVPEEPRAPKK